MPGPIVQSELALWAPLLAAGQVPNNSPRSIDEKSAVDQISLPVSHRAERTIVDVKHQDESFAWPVEMNDTLPNGKSLSQTR